MAKILIMARAGGEYLVYSLPNSSTIKSEYPGSKAKHDTEFLISKPNLPVMINTSKPLVEYQDTGIVDYKEAWDYQEKLFSGIVDRKIRNRRYPEKQVTPNNYLLFCEHPHVYTLGKSGNISNLLLNPKQLEEKEATFYKINRGGDITYHGPGQLVGYPLLDLDQFFTDIHKYLRLLEEAVIRTLKEYGINSGRLTGFTGVWLDPEIKEKARKICALGVKCSRWVTMHGFAFNVNSNLDYFSNIVPCGIDDKDVTSMQRELGKEVEMEEVKAKLLGHLQDLFDWKFKDSRSD